MRKLSFGVERRFGRSRSQTFDHVTASRRAKWIVVTLLCLTGSGATATSAAAETATYSATQTIPVPPASNFAGSSGGDGWAVALSEENVYNVFHHDPSHLIVACHRQADATACPEWPKTVSEPGGSDFTSSAQPGMYLDQHTGKLYVYTTRLSDNTGGVLCVDTESTEADPYCGFTELTGKGEAPLTFNREISGMSNPMLIGTHWYSFNFVTGTQKGTENTLACFDVGTDQPCAGQPYSVTIPSGNVTTAGNEPVGETAAIAGKTIIPIAIENQTSWLACWDDATQSSCAGAWPVKLSFPYVSTYGAPFPLMDSTGKTIGLCLPTGTDQCFNLAGESTTTPEKMPEAISATEEWNGPAFVLGPRVYVPNGEEGTVDCFDYATGEGCANFPKSFEGLELLYTVNPDPQRPTCIWINSDSGQIQNFDAYTGEACGQGTIRVLASQFVVPEPQCTPASYISLQVLKPARSTYSSGMVAFAEGDGNPIGLPEQALDETGTVSLAGLELNTSTGLPQFLFTLSGESEEVEAIEIKLTWTGDYSASCVGEKTTVTTQPQQTTTTQTTTTQTSTPTSTPVAKGGVSAFKRARLAGRHRACIAGHTYRASVSGKLIASVTFKVNGHRVAKLTKPNSHGKFVKQIKLRAGHREKLTIHVAYTKSSGSPATKIKRTLARCAVHHRKTPRFTG